MSNETQDKLGKLLNKFEPKDAVHIAVFAAVSDYIVTAGSKVTLERGSNSKVLPTAENPIGVVDPFIKGRIVPGNIFYVFMYPGTIISLNHNWTHPSFLSTEEPRKQMSESEEWLRAFCVMHKADFDELILAVVNGSVRENGEGPSFGTDRGAELLREQDWEFWDYMEQFTGKKFSEDHRALVASNTSCAC